MKSLREAKHKEEKLRKRQVIKETGRHKQAHHALEKECIQSISALSKDFYFRLVWGRPYCGR